MRLFTRASLLIFLGLASMSSFAQKAGEKVFDNTIVHEVKLTFEENDFWRILQRNYDDNPTPAPVPYLMGDVVFDGVELDSIGVRLKGFTSYWTNSDKKPIKLDFNEFVSGKKIDGLKKMNLNNGTGDPALQRDIVCYDLLNKVGVPAPRTSFAKVYINETYWGLYQVIEQIDKVFLNENYASPKGNLFKNKAWSSLEYFGSDKNDYKEIFQLKTNEEEDNWDGFINLMDLLNNANNADFEEEIESMFNVDLFLKTLAVDVATNNWDSYMEHGRNWYMYEDTSTNIFHWVPWDYNLALGGTLSFGGGDDCTLFPDFYAHTDGTDSVQFYVGGFAPGPVSYSWTFGDGGTSTEESPKHTYNSPGEYQVCVTFIESPDCEEQYCERIETTYDYAQCSSVVDGDFKGEVGLSFIQVIEWEPSCCGNWSGECQELFEDIEGQNNGGFGGYPIDQSESEKLLIQRLWDIDKYKQRYYSNFCRMMNRQFVADDYKALISENVNLISEAIEEDQNALYPFTRFMDDGGEEGLMDYIESRIETLNTELDELQVCQSTTPSVAVGEVVINEFVASNDSTSLIVDDAGETDDWIELFNTTSGTIDLSDTYLSDDREDFKKWQFPLGTEIQSGEYMIIWADKDEEQTGFHADFKLGKSGETLIFSNDDNSVIDSIQYGEQETNISFARIPNGTGEFVQKESTFGFNNTWVSSTNETEALAVSIYPNPTSNTLTIEMDQSDVSNVSARVFTVDGRLIHVQTIDGSEGQIDVKPLETGMYFIEISNEEGYKASMKFIKM